MTILIDTREPSPHPWTAYWPDTPTATATLETGDICAAGNLDIVIERKTPADLLGCMTSGRERFERELRRATHLASFAVVISGSFDDLLLHRRGMAASSVIGTLAAWQRRYRHPFFFAGNDELAADFTMRFLSQPFREASVLTKQVA